MAEFMNILVSISIPLSIYSIVMYVIYMISFYNLFKKEEIKQWYAFIPFYNFYLYFKLCSVPFILFFIPIINIVTITLIPYKLAKRYGYNKLYRWSAVLLPFLYVPLICYSDKDNIYHEHTNVFVESNKDIDELEKQLIINSKIELMNLNEKEEKELIKQEKRKEDEIDKIEASIDNSFDEIIYDENNKQEDFSQVESLLDSQEPEVEQLEFVDDMQDIDISEIEKLDNQIDLNKKEKNIEQDFKEIQNDVKVETIAFGGQEMVDKYSTQTKDDELKCPRCGSSLIGAKDFCPGCNLDLKELNK